MEKSFSLRLYETGEFDTVHGVAKAIQRQPELRSRFVVQGQLLPIEKDLLATWGHETLWLICRERSYPFEQMGSHPDLKELHGFTLDVFNRYREAAQRNPYPAIVVVRSEGNYYYIYLDHLFLHGERVQSWFRHRQGQLQKPKPALLVPLSAMLPVFDRSGRFKGFDEPDYDKRR